MSNKKISSGQKTKTELAQRLKFIMESCQIKNQREFAQLTQMTDGYVSKLFRGAVDNLSKNAALSIERVTGFSSQWILTGEGEQYSEQENPITVVVGMEVMRMLNEMREREVEHPENTQKEIEQFKDYCREQDIPEEYLAEPLEEEGQEVYTESPEFSTLLETLKALRGKDPKLSGLIKASKAIRAKTPSSNQLKTAVAIKALSKQSTTNDFKANLFQSLKDPSIRASTTSPMGEDTFYKEMKERISELKDTISAQKKLISMQEQEIKMLKSSKQTDDG